VDWLKGPSLAVDREGRVSIVYTRDPGPAMPYDVGAVESRTREVRAVATWVKSD
jgi:hypothetical protein